MTTSRCSAPRGRGGREFLAELHRNRLPGKAVWKINCRADAVDPELFVEMQRAGLHMVYMGLASGSEEGLKTLRKQITVEQIIRDVEILKQIGVCLEFGFMLPDPLGTFESVRTNLQFLRTIVGVGSAAAGFDRMVPYDGTPMKPSWRGRAVFAATSPGPTTTSSILG